MALSLFADDRVSTVLSDSFSGLFFFWLVARAAQGFGGWTKTVLELRPLVYLGKISYGIYLIHLFVPYVVWKVMERLGLMSLSQNKAFLIPLWTGVTVWGAMLSWHAFEKPINDLKKTWRLAGGGDKAG